MSSLEARAEAAMSFRVSGKNLDVGEALRARINSRVGEAMSKYFDGGYSGHVTVAREGTGFHTECAVHLDSKITLRAPTRRCCGWKSSCVATIAG